MKSLDHVSILQATAKSSQYPKKKKISNLILHFWDCRVGCIPARSLGRVLGPEGDNARARPYRASQMRTDGGAESGVVARLKDLHDM
jgi:hypothetical protein